MKNFTIYSLAVAALLLLTACGGGAEEQDLDKLKSELQELKAERKDLDAQIREVEDRLDSLDPSLKPDIRVPVSVVEAKTSTFSHFVKVSGALEADNSIQVSPKMGGVITRVYVKEGQRVKAGQILAQLDDAVLQKSLLELETQQALADTLYARQKNLWAQEIGTEIQLLQAKTNAEALERRIGTTREQLAMLNITAPISGVVDAVNAKLGEAVAPGFPAFNVVNFRELSFKADVSESYVPYIKRGNQARINFPSIDHSVQAQISNVSQTINPVNRTVAIEAKVPARNELLKANMVGEIEINDATREDAIVLPLSNILLRGNEEYVMVAVRDAGGNFTAKRVVVETGLSYEGQVEVVRGLNKGDQIITEGADGLVEGAEVVFQPSN